MGTQLGRGHASVSIVIPVLNDGLELARLLGELDELASTANVSPEIIVIDGGSNDDSLKVARSAGVLVISAARNRGLQLDEGARSATASWLWFVHADTVLNAHSLQYMHELREPGWGRFDIEIKPTSTLLKLVAWFMNERSRVSGICTGDQGIFVHNTLLSDIGGVPRQPLMEDIELSKRLVKHSRPLAPAIKLMTSARRWQRRGTIRTIVAMWYLRWRYWCGADPVVLARQYYG